MIRAVLFDVYGTLLISASGDISASQTQTITSAGKLGPPDASNLHEGNSRHPEESMDSQETEATPQCEAFQKTLAELGWSCSDDGRLALMFLNSEIQAEHERLRTAGIEFPEVDIVRIWERVFHRLAANSCRLHRETPVRQQTITEFGTCGSPMTPDLPSQLTANEIQVFALCFELRVNPVWPMPGVRECLSELSNRGIALGIVSNAQFMTPELVRVLLESKTLCGCFDQGLCFYSYQSRHAKPGLEMYRQAALELHRRGILPDHALYIGNDQLKDVWPASQLGFRTGLFAGDARSHRERRDDPRASSVSADLVLTQWQQLPKCLT